MARILLADDNREVLVMLSSWLRLEDGHTVDTAADGAQALDFASTYIYEAIVLDWEMPRLSGVELCGLIKEKHPDIPVLMLTGKDTVADRIKGLDSGADDYLTKPFSAEELSARIRALLRRSAQKKTSEKLLTGTLELEPLSHKATLAGKVLSLSPIEFQLLDFFARNPGQTFSPEALLERVWTDSADGTVAAVRTTINRLRGKLQDACGQSCLETERGLGYKFRSPS